MASAPTPLAESAPERFKYRLRFQKGGDLRLVSHHDLMHCCERLFRRADIPVASTQGFHPSPRMVFALSLSLGVLGSNEVLELELTRDLPEPELLDRLRSAAPPGLIFRDVRRIPLKNTAQVRRSFYRIPLIPDDGREGADAVEPMPIGEVCRRCEELLRSGHLWMDRDKPYRRRVDIRPFIESTRIVAGSSLEFVLWMTPFGTAKPDEILRLLALNHLPEEGAVLERFDLELIDEVGPDAPPPPVVDPKAIISTTTVDIAIPARSETSDSRRPGAPAPEEPRRPHGLIEGPMSFDT